MRLSRRPPRAVFRHCPVEFRHTPPRMQTRLHLVQPVLAKPFRRDGWVYEEKYDADPRRRGGGVRREAREPDAPAHGPARRRRRHATDVHHVRLLVLPRARHPVVAVEGRRKVMEDEIDSSSVLPARRLREDGQEAWGMVQARVYEGLVAKDSTASYAPSTRWRQVKVRHEARVLIGGVVVT